MRLPCSLGMISTRSCCHTPTQLRPEGGGKRGAHGQAGLALTEGDLPQKRNPMVWRSGKPCVAAESGKCLSRGAGCASVRKRRTVQPH